MAATPPWTEATTCILVSVRTPAYLPSPNAALNRASFMAPGSLLLRLHACAPHKEGRHGVSSLVRDEGFSPVGEPSRVGLDKVHLSNRNKRLENGGDIFRPLMTPQAIGGFSVPHLALDIRFNLLLGPA